MRIWTLAACVALGACESSTAAGMGTVRLHLAGSDAAGMIAAAVQSDFGDVTSATVTIARVELVPGDVLITDFGGTSKEYDLLEMDTEASALLGSAPALGEYEQLRLVVTEASVTVNGETFELRTPSGAQSGIKVNFGGPIEVGPGATVDLLALFDLSGSFVFQGPPDAPKGVSFKPVIHASTMEAASIAGTATLASPPNPAPSLTVVAKVGSEVVATAIADATTGAYVLRLLRPGDYVVEATATGYQKATRAVNGVTEGEVVTGVNMSLVVQ